MSRRAGGDGLAYLAPDATLTYEELRRQVNRMGHLLRELGVRREQRVLLVLDDTTAFPIAFLGAMRIGAVPVPVSMLDKRERFRHYIEDSYAEVVVCEAPACRSSRARCPPMRAVLVRGEDGEGGVELAGALAAQDDELEALATHADDVPSGCTAPVRRASQGCRPPALAASRSRVRRLRGACSGSVGRHDLLHVEAAPLLRAGQQPCVSAAIRGHGDPTRGSAEPERLLRRCASSDRASSFRCRRCTRCLAEDRDGGSASTRCGSAARLPLPFRVKTFDLGGSVWDRDPGRNRLHRDVHLLLKPAR